MSYVVYVMDKTGETHVRAWFDTYEEARREQVTAAAVYQVCGEPRTVYVKKEVL